MQNFLFTDFREEGEKDKFKELLDIFTQLLQYTNGDAGEALDWMHQLDNQHDITDNQYGMGDFIRDLQEKGYLKENEVEGDFSVTNKMGQVIRKQSLDEIFGQLKKAGKGEHKTNKTGNGDELSSDSRPFDYGDTFENINFTASIRNAQINHGIDDFNLTENDLEVSERESKTTNSTVLMIDISHSMILYGEDRITPAKKVAMALAELIKTRYPKDTLDILVFGNDAWPVEVKDLPFLQVGPYHTNTYAGLQLAMDMLRRRKTANKQIFMITDGKPTCLKEGTRYYKNSWGLDKKILNKTLTMAAQCRRLKIPITTFMIAKDPWLVRFVEEFTRTNNGRAFYSNLNGLGEYIFEDYIRNRKKTVR
ncbi:MAG: VWA domain-containing protein [Bacteroidota bacterium]